MREPDDKNTRMIRANARRQETRRRNAFKPAFFAPDLDALQGELARWLTLYSWDWFATLTFSQKQFRVRPALAWRVLESYLGELAAWTDSGGGCFRAFAAQEFGAEGDNAHFHLLVGGLLPDTFARSWWKFWKEGLGRARIDAYDPALGAGYYVSKYLLKDARQYGEWRLLGAWQPLSAQSGNAGVRPGRLTGEGLPVLRATKEREP
jgi:hypothetical protein